MIENLNQLIKAADLIEENQTKKIVKPVLEKLCEKTGAHICEIFRTDLGSEYEVTMASLSTIEKKDDTDRIRSDPYVLTGRPDPNFWVWVYENKKPLWVENLQTHNKDHGIRNKATGQDIDPNYIRFFPKSDLLVVIPLISKNTVWGIFSIESPESDVFNKDIIEELKLLGTCITKLLIKSYIHHQNKTDTNDAIEKFESIVGVPGSRIPFSQRTGFIAYPFESEYMYAASKLREFFEKKHVRILDSLPIEGGTSILGDLKEKIPRSHFGIADITQLNSNVLFELGMMLLCMAEEDILIFRHKSESSDLPSDIKHLNRIIYKYELKEDELHIDVPGKSTSEKCNESLTNFLNRLIRRNTDFKKANEYRG